MNLLDAKTKLSPVAPFVTTEKRWVEVKGDVDLCYGGGDIESVSLLNKYSTKRFLVRVGVDFFEFAHEGHLPHHERVAKIQHLANRDLTDYINDSKAYAEARSKAHWL